jgi:Neuraminidase (sialidase)
MKNQILLFVLVIFYSLLGSQFVHGETGETEDKVLFKYNPKTDKFGYRIPALTTTKKGTLLAFAERRHGMHDHAQNDIILRRSEDNGLTWGEEIIVAEDGKNSLNDPCVVVLNSGRILLMYQKFPYGVHNYDSHTGWIQIADRGYDGPRNTKTFLIHSDDDGKTWSEPREISKSIRPSESIHIGSPGRGIQLTRGEHKGRIILPLYEMYRDGRARAGSRNSVAYSDDNGKTWNVSNNIPHWGLTGYGNEAQVVETEKGNILFIARNAEGYYRKIARSKDGGRTWDHMNLDFGLPGTPCMGSVLRFSWPENGKSHILQSSPANRHQRKNGTVRLSNDEGQSWEYSREVVSGYFGYSCLTKLNNGQVGLLYESFPEEGPKTIKFKTFTLDYIKEGDKKQNPTSYLDIPLIDLDDETHRQVIVDKEKDQYLGHPTTVLLDDNKTILCVYPKGHGGGEIVYKRSKDGGLTWSDRLPTPESWKTSKEVPTIYPVEGKYGNDRLIMFSGLYPARMAVSENKGKAWSGLKQIGDWGGIVVMSDLIPLKSGKGHYMAFFHDDKRFMSENGVEKYKQDRKNFNSPMFTLYKTVSEDGGLTWSYPEVITKSRQKHICEPGVVRSPDGKQIAMLLRENSKRFNSQIIFSNDEGKTWTEPSSLPNELTGDRHVAAYSPDGRLVIFFRDVSQSHGKIGELSRKHDESNYGEIAKNTGYGSPNEGDWVAWVGTYQDLVEGNKGQYRIRLKDNKVSGDCAYTAAEVLPDGTFVATTYGHWQEGQEPYILSVRFKLEEIDRKVEKME